MKHLKEFWQLWGKFSLALMRKTGLQMLIGSLFFSLGAGFVMSKMTIPPVIFTDSAATIFSLIAGLSLCMAIVELAVEQLPDDDKPEPAAEAL